MYFEACLVPEFTRLLNLRLFVRTIYILAAIVGIIIIIIGFLINVQV